MRELTHEDFRRVQKYLVLLLIQDLEPKLKTMKSDKHYDSNNESITLSKLWSFNGWYAFVNTVAELGNANYINLYRIYTWMFRATS